MRAIPSAQRLEARPRLATSGPGRSPATAPERERLWSVSQTVVALQRAAQGAQWYPDEQTDRLRSRIAALHRVTLDQVVLGCGSSEILRMAVDAFVGPRRQLVVARPTFEWISECARRSGAEIAAVPLSADYSHDLDAMLARAHATTGLVYICNPNNPTGTLTRRRDVEAFVGKLPRSAYVLIDEAHHHYAGSPPTTHRSSTAL